MGLDLCELPPAISSHWIPSAVKRLHLRRKVAAAMSDVFGLGVLAIDEGIVLALWWVRVVDENSASRSDCRSIDQKLLVCSHCEIHTGWL